MRRRRDGVTTVLVVHPETLLRQVLVHLLAEVPDLHVVGEAATGAEAVRVAASLRPDLAVVDEDAVSGAHEDALALLKARLDGGRIVLLLQAPSETSVEAARTAGVDGFALKTISLDGMIDTLRRVAALQPRRKQILPGRHRRPRA